MEGEDEERVLHSNGRGLVYQGLEAAVDVSVVTLVHQTHGGQTAGGEEGVGVAMEGAFAAVASGTNSDTAAYNADPRQDTSVLRKEKRKRYDMTYVIAWPANRYLRLHLSRHCGRRRRRYWRVCSKAWA